MNENWNWVGRYVSVIVIAVILASVLGSMDLFETTTVMAKKLSAANIVKFLGYGAALVVLWLLAQRAVVVLRAQGGPWGFLQHLLLPVATLIVVASAHSVILLLVRRMLDASARNLYNWLFIAGIIAAAAWLVMALFNQSSSLTEAFTSAATRLGNETKARQCPKCSAGIQPGAKFCADCGTRVEA